MKAEPQALSARSDRRARGRAVAAAAMAVATIAVLLTAPGCGEEAGPRSLDTALLKRSQLPAGLPPLAASVSDGGPAAWARVTAPDRGRRRALAQLRRAGFRRGSARQYRSAGSGPRILLLIEAAAELEDGDGAQQVAENAADRAVREAKRRSRRAAGDDREGGPAPRNADALGEDALSDLGDWRRGIATSVRGVPVYAVLWRRERIVLFLSLAANPNGGPGGRDLAALARRMNRRIPR